MGRPTNDDQKDSSNPTDDGQNRRRTRRRRKLLNLGLPFVQVDDFLNQSEDAVALGYRVLEDTVEEIKEGYEEAKRFNQKQREWDGKGPAPAIEWEQLVARAQKFQNIALQVVKEGTDIFVDSIRSGTDSMKSVAKTWQQSRSDVEAKPPLAGPVFEGLIDVTVRAGDRATPVEKQIRHRGLTRLRIHAVMDPPLKELQPFGTGRDTSRSGPLNVEKVRFEPASERDDEEVSVLTVDIGHVSSDQPVADYEGLIRAQNFELLIARLRVRVLPPGEPTSYSTEARRPARGKRKTRPTTKTPYARAATKTK